MVSQYDEPDASIKKELVVAIKRIFSDHFRDTNIHPRPLGINYQREGGVWTATVSLNWQRGGDFRYGTNTAVFEYLLRDSPHGRDRYWYCKSGLPGD